MAALFAAGALLGAGCGDDKGGGGDDDALAKAKTFFVDQCHMGHEGDDKDLKLCQCGADELQANHGYDATKFKAATDQAEKGSLPPYVIQAFGACKNK